MCNGVFQKPAVATRCKGNKISCLLQIVNAVVYIHQKGYIHRDLKPSNVLFSLDGKVKVCDFGLVTRVHVTCDDAAALDRDGATSRRTKGRGTRGYMAPEQVSLLVCTLENVL